jgi:tRNA pseudouridine38-40 synthase
VHHIALGVEYDGHAFHGWQRQPGQRSVQQTLEEALSKIADHPIRLTAAGRTDAGVHATQQVVAFATSAQRPDRAWTRGTNSLLPDALSVRWAIEVPPHFHPRYSATARRYHYIFLEADRAPAIARHYVTWSAARLDDAAMHIAAQHLVGEHDFTSFRSAACQAKSPFRCVFGVAVRRFADLVVLDITANAFLQHMVRNIAGGLLQVGRGDKPAAWIGEVLIARNRDLVGATAPPHGLYLVDVQYGAAFELPRAQPPLILRALGDVW